VRQAWQTSLHAAVKQSICINVLGFGQFSKILRHWQRNSRACGLKARIPQGHRVYAIGDVHGCADLLAVLLERIDADDFAREPAETTVVFLGDLIDRGPDSARVLDMVADLQTRRNVRLIVGNHEEMFLASFGSGRVLRQFLQHGGRETILSYMEDADAYARLTIEELREQLPRLVPERHLQLLRSMDNILMIGDYVFVHAGIRPGVPLAEQSEQDLRWIRKDFLDADFDPGFVVVHGHTVAPDVISGSCRIGIDTGAYLHGRLTAIGLEGVTRWFLHEEKAIASPMPVVSA
jgi:serine/threonine protein phosphatase 1